MSSFYRRVIKSATAGVFHYSGLRHAVAAVRRARSGGRRVLIVGYHRVVEDFDQELRQSIPASLVSTGVFRRHLEEAARAGFEFATVDQALEALAGRGRGTKDLFVLTFDDGYRDISRHAFPILKALGIPAIVYLPSAYVGTARRFDHDRLFHLVRIAQKRRYQPRYGPLPLAARPLLDPVLRHRCPLQDALDDFFGEAPSTNVKETIEALANELGESPEPRWGEVMDWDDARRMASAGICFGAHTMEHLVLTLESPECIEREISGSKDVIERKLNRRVEHFAYVNGWYSEAMIERLAAHGFRSGLTTEDLPNQIGGNPFALKRKVMGENYSLGMSGQYSAALTACSFDDVFNVIGVRRPVLGKRPNPSTAA